jgi:amylosucrase
MYNHQLHQEVNKCLKDNAIDIAGADNLFYIRMLANTSAIHFLYEELYGKHPGHHFTGLLETMISAYKKRSIEARNKDAEKESTGNWFLSNEITGMSLYVDRFCGNISSLGDKLAYFKKLGVNLLHVMPVMQSPAGESDGGYAVSDFRKVDERFGTLADLKLLQKKMGKAKMYLMMDIVLNHTSHQHAWALKAKKGERRYQDFYYMSDDEAYVTEFGKSMPDIFPEAAPGNFTWNEASQKWVMTVFHNYQWDLNYTNPDVFTAMLDNIFFYANLGVDILRIDAPAFIWKEKGTTCQNLPQAHTILRLIKQCVQVAAPGMAILGEAIVAPKEILKYFGNGLFTAKECDLAYNATQMALQWDALATGDTRVMLAAQHELLQKPYGTSWITYTRCHDDIGLGYDDYMIERAGYNPYEHRKFLKEYYAGIRPGSPARGALFSVNPVTQDARISGTLASLCGLEWALHQDDTIAISLAIQKILLMQAHSLFIGGIPMLFYGDEVGYTNDYSFLKDAAKSYDNRWMHRPLINREKNKRVEIKGTVEAIIFNGTQKLIELRRQLAIVADTKNLTWLSPFTNHVAGCLRTLDEEKLYCLFNYSQEPVFLSWDVFKQHGPAPARLYDYLRKEYLLVDSGSKTMELPGYGFFILQSLPQAL